MLLTWWRRRKRRKLRDRPFPDEWDEMLRHNVGHDRTFNDQEKAKHRKMVRIFVAEKYWEGCGGLEITDEVKVTIAGMACLLVLGFDDECFDRLQTILVYPSEYVAKETSFRPGGVVVESASPRYGEAWHRGPVILSWPSVLAAGRNPNNGDNVVLHEFAHVLDMQNHQIDGTPPLEDRRQRAAWQDIMTSEYNRLVEQADEGRFSLLSHYGATNEAEFFAVATECFFEQPAEMAEQYPKLYGLLRDFYRQDPAQRVDRSQ